MISSSAPEPLCDVLAQLAAIADPSHPKDAVWLAKGTPLADLLAVRNPEGMLLTTDAAKAATFEGSPTDETLAVVLGYPESKGEIEGEPIVVHALNPNGAVVTEMAASPTRLCQAIRAAGSHGVVRVLTLVDALSRRARLSRGFNGA